MAKDKVIQSKNVIEINDLTFSYKADPGKKAVDNINLVIPKGQFVVIMGPSGAGKSTLANSLNGLIPGFLKGKYIGEVLINRKKVKGRQVSEMAREIGLVFQDFEAQLFSTNVNLELAFGPENFQIEREEIVRRINHVLKTVKLEGFEKRQPATLSGGQKQRLAIGSVLATYPDIICMDEPTTDLDPIGKLGIFNIAKELHESSEFTLLIVEHETEEALNADRLIIMGGGKILKDGKPELILSDVQFTDSVGIMSLQIPSYFKQLLNISKDKLPLDPKSGVSMFLDKKIIFNEDKYKEIIKSEDERKASYGKLILTVNNLVHIYPNGNKAVDDISFDIREREFMAILGHNGSGKTTLVKHFNSLLSPTEGNVKVYGNNTREHSIFEIGKDIGYVFQNPDHQIFADTVFEEVAFSPKIRGIKDEEVKVRVAEALKAVDLEGYEEEDPFSLSKGERQRVAVASILSARPKIIILDEPTTGLDYSEQKKMMELIKQLNMAGHTIIMITHTMWVVSEYAHRVAVIRDGRVI
ncbi:MAG: energy-coupling factor transporter ATPase, partial [Spirochaetales bacterium]|nr:energy-coupling factor transporter ATPase [Spirochaetales bacterium]